MLNSFKSSWAASIQVLCVPFLHEAQISELSWALAFL